LPLYGWIKTVSEDTGSVLNKQPLSGIKSNSQKQQQTLIQQLLKSGNGQSFVFSISRNKNGKGKDLKFELPAADFTPLFFVLLRGFFKAHFYHVLRTALDGLAVLFNMVGFTGVVLTQKHVVLFLQQTGS